jgi:hypothetical protein
MEVLCSEDCFGKKLLIVGDVNTGKTTLCRKLLADLCQKGLGERIAIIDMAPHIPAALARQRGIVGAGGNLRSPVGSEVLDLRVHLEPPRLSSRTEAEALSKAKRNAKLIEILLEKLVPEERDIVLINDVTLYLQAESAVNLIEHAAFARINTLVVNGYFGTRLGGGALTEREKTETESLWRWFEKNGSVVRLKHEYS